jgi:flagellar hook protein FlgE
MNGMFNALSGMLASAQKLQNSANNLVSLGKNKVGEDDNPGIRPNLNLTEGKDVNISKEMVNQIIAKSEFKANVKVINVADENIGTILDIKS